MKNLCFYEGTDINDIYLRMLSDVVTKGRKYSPKGKDTLEIRPAITYLEKAYERRFLILPGRKLNYAFAIAEAVWILEGRGDNDFISTFNANFSQFSDDGITFHGSYGKRIRHANYTESQKAFDRVIIDDKDSLIGQNSYEVDQIAHVIKKLWNDPDTRQAVITLWDPVKDNLFKAKDYPCNIACMFKQRDDELSINIARRSNDIIWGVPYNIVQFTTLQEHITYSIDARIGDYTEDIDSLHIYTNLYKNLDKWLKIALTDEYKAVTSELVDVLYEGFNNEIFHYEFGVYLFNIHQIFKKGKFIDSYKEIVRAISLELVTMESRQASYFIVAFLLIKEGNIIEAMDVVYKRITIPLFKYMLYEQFSAVRSKIKLQEFIKDDLLCSKLEKIYQEVI